MFRFLGKKRGQKIEEALGNMFEKEKGRVSSYEETLAYFKDVFKDDDPIEYREILIGQNTDMRACLIFCDGLTDAQLIDNFLIRPLMKLEGARAGDFTADSLISNVLQINCAKKTRDMCEVIQAITYGDTLLLAEGIDESLIFSTKSFTTRSVTEPEGETVLSGPREGFTEIMMTNLSMVRRRLRTEKLKMRYYCLGKQTNTQICIAYLDGIAKPEILKELYKRLDEIDIDSILDANYITELITDNKWSPFPSTGYTERPDVIAAKLLEGRIAIFVDGTPVVLTLPYLFIENFQSNEDYYLNFYYTTFSRMLRFLGFFLTIMVPGIYIAVVAYHQEMLPAPLIISVAIERKNVPLPAAFEALIMLVVFEILRETALRMQTNVGQALSIVGALVVGQAAVEAKLIAAPMIIVIALTGITSLLVPKMNAAILLLRFGILILASCMGFLGVTVGFALMLAHVLSLKSFGLWQVASSSQITLPGMKDMLVRAPWDKMIIRPKQISVNDKRQVREGQQ